MRIAVDLIAAEYEPGALLLATRSLLHGLAQIDHENEFIVLTVRPDDYQELAKLPNMHIQPVSLPSQHGVLIQHQLFSPRILQEIKPDILHVPAFAAPVSWHGALVMTIHNLACIKTLEQPSLYPRLHHNYLQRASAYRAQRIITTSEQTRQHITEHWSMPAERLCLIYRALRPSLQRATISETAIQAMHSRYGQRYLLHVDRIMPSKNVGRLIKAFDLLAARLPDLHLVLTGGLDYASPKEVQLIETSPYRKRIHLAGWIAEEDLGPLYAGASILILPSRHEGQDIAILEAMACGTPVIASDEAANMEIADDSILRTDCSSTLPLVEAIAHILTDEKLRAHLIQAGYKQIQPFHHQTCARATLQVYQEALDMYRYSFSDKIQAVYR